MSEPGNGAVEAKAVARILERLTDYKKDAGPAGYKTTGLTLDDLNLIGSILRILVALGDIPMVIKIIGDHKHEIADLQADDAFKNERDHINQSGRMKTTVAAMDWAAREIERLRNALEEINAQAVCFVIATPGECFQMLENCAEISEKALGVVGILK
jgi:hypothetical protein